MSAGWEAFTQNLIDSGLSDGVIYFVGANIIAPPSSRVHQPEVERIVKVITSNEKVTSLMVESQTYMVLRSSDDDEYLMARCGTRHMAVYGAQQQIYVLGIVDTTGTGVSPGSANEITYNMKEYLKQHCLSISKVKSARN
jgi:hypothetical protein